MIILIVFNIKFELWLKIIKKKIKFKLKIIYKFKIYNYFLFLLNNILY